MSEKQGKFISKLMAKTDQLALTIGRLVLLGMGVLLVCLLLVGLTSLTVPVIGGSLSILSLTLALLIGGSWSVQHMENNDNYFD